MVFFGRLKSFLKRWLRGWRLIFLVVLFLIGGLIANAQYKSKNDTSNILTEIVKRQDIKQTVLATGAVSSTTDLNLSFKTAGLVKQVNAKVGNVVKIGTVLATLEIKDQTAVLTSARGSLASAQANYDRILAGASSEEVAVAQAAVDAAKTALEVTKNQQKVLVANSLSALNNSTLIASQTAQYFNSPTVTISGTYNSTQQGEYRLSGYLAGDGAHINVTGLEDASILAQANIPIPLGNRGLYVEFSNVTSIAGNSWTIQIPNTQAANYITNLNAYNAAVQNEISAVNMATSSLDQAMVTLDLKKAQARPAELDAARAQILSAQGQVEAALAGIENGTIRAPADGTITKVDLKIGQLINSFTPAIVLQNINQLHLEANVSEANVAQISQGQIVDVTFDAFGPDEQYQAIVQNIDLSPTVVSGVVNYKITASLDSEENIRPGMTANMTIRTNEKSGIIAVPQRAVIDQNDKKIVRVVTDPKKKTHREVIVQTGIYADGGLIEIKSGLSEGWEIITFINKK